MAHPTDIHVGKRILRRRRLLGMSQMQVAEHLGVTFQQLQKYETGVNRVSASRLWDLALLFNVPAGYFFEGLLSEALVFERGAAEQQADDFAILFSRLSGEQRAAVSGLVRAFTGPRTVAR